MYPDTTKLPPEIRKALKTPLAQMRKHVAKIAEHRDALRSLVSDIDEIVDTCDEGVEEIERGLEAISRYV